MEIRTSTYGVIERSKVTTKGHLMRYQKRTGTGLKLLFIRNREGTYHINMHTNDGAKWDDETAKGVERVLVNGGPQGDPQAFLRKVKAKNSGRDTVNGRAAEVWTYRLPAGPNKTQFIRIFMDVKEKRPLKLEMRQQISKDRTDGITIEYKSYRWGFPLADSFFSLPPGAKVVDLENPKAGPIIVPGGPKRSEKPAPVKRVSAVDRTR
jgi:hypothetical protein